MNLLLPVAGMSSRFPGMRPKWLLTHPNGNLMIAEAISGLNLQNYNYIYIITIKEHVDRYGFLNCVKRQFDSIGQLDKLKIVVLENRTESQPETIFKAIIRENISGGIYIKDSDNFFTESRCQGNFVSTYDLNDMPLAYARNKSYVETNNRGILTNIVEKRVISSTFNVGGYGFSSADDFVRYYKQLEDYDQLFISHIIYKMMLDGIDFEKSSVGQYIDWGTINEWNLYKSRYVTLFVNVDGVLVKNSDIFYGVDGNSSVGIEANIDAVNRLYDSGSARIILTTSRGSIYRAQILNDLSNKGIKYHDVIFDLYQGKSVVINNYDLTKPYKSCHAINIRTNSDSLSEMLDDLLPLR